MYAIRSYYGATGLNKVAGEPFKVSELTEKIMEMIK